MSESQLRDDEVPHRQPCATAAHAVVALARTNRLFRTSHRQLMNIEAPGRLFNPRGAHGEFGLKDKTLML